MQDLVGRTVSSDQLRGHVVVLSFWATWCQPCQEELPKIQAVSKRYGANPKVSILAVDSGTEGDTPEKVRSYLLRRQLDLPVLIDSPDGWSLGPAARSLAVPGLPALYLIDSAGRLRRVHLGYDASEDLETSVSRQIDSFLW
jgi:thiol-disulfide isomerase/thioredoxin